MVIKELLARLKKVNQTRLTSQLTVGPRIQERGDRRQMKGKIRQEGKYRRLETGESRQEIGERK